MKNQTNLQNHLERIDHKGYPAYKDTKGSYDFGDYILNIDHVQGDPFASPSKVSISLSGNRADFPKGYYNQPYKRIPLQDHLTRLFSKSLGKYTFKAKGSGKSGLISISQPKQEILERTACKINPANGDILLRLEIGFPARGRTIDSRELIKIFFDFLPKCVSECLFYSSIDQKKLQDTIYLAEDQQYIRKQLDHLGLIAFVANGSILPRESGVSSLPMKSAIPFSSPASMEFSMDLPHHGTLTGMGIKKGITLIVGGGYHGKSTLLKALELGVYNHITGDGREYVISTDNAMKIRAEDGRSIKNADISMFINNLPNGRDTKSFSTEDASGSTSQAANVVEAMESGTSLFLIDEDTCATNFMIRDELMQRVVHRDQEPITPFIERVRELYDIQGISSIIVAGSSGSYFHVADCVIQMDRYVPREITKLAKAESSAFPAMDIPMNNYMEPAYRRVLHPSKDFSGNSRIKMKTLGKDAFSLNKGTVDLRYIEQLVDSEQTTALSYLLKYAHLHLVDNKKTLQQIVAELVKLMDSKGLDSLADGPYLSANLAMPRPQEIFACFNRYRG